MAEQGFVVCHTGTAPPEDVLSAAGQFGIQFVTLGDEGRPVETPIEAIQRLDRLRPDAYLQNEPHFGPFLSKELLDAAGEQLKVVNFEGQSREISDYSTFVDVGAMVRRGIVFAIAGGAEVSVAESALVQLHALNMDLVAADVAIKAGRDWPVKTRTTLLGGSLGIVGMGRVGRRLAKMGAGLGMRINYTSRRRRFDVEDDVNARPMPLTTLFAESAYVSVHTPGHTTRNLIDRDVLSVGREILLVNTTSEPSVVEPAALIEGLQRGWVARAAVEGSYPSPYQEELVSFVDQVLLLPAYMSWDTTHARQRHWEMLLETYRALLDGRSVPNRLA